METSSTLVEFSIKILKEEIKLVNMEIYQFDYRDKSFWLALFVFFGQHYSHAKSKINSFAIKSFTSVWKILIGNLTEETKSVVMKT